MTDRQAAEVPSLEELLTAGEIKSALLLDGDFSPSERELIRRAWEAGLAAGKAEVDALSARLAQLDAENELLSSDLNAQTRAKKKAEVALREIAEQDPVELALDPQWSQRIARAALGGADG